MVAALADAVCRPARPDNNAPLYVHSATDEWICVEKKEEKEIKLTIAFYCIKYKYARPQSFNLHTQNEGKNYMQIIIILYYALQNTQ